MNAEVRPAPGVLVSGALLVVLLLAPAILSPFAIETWMGMRIRLLLNASTSAVALLGLSRFYRAGG
jgi:hypothetical protein